MSHNLHFPNVSQIHTYISILHQLNLNIFQLFPCVSNEDVPHQGKPLVEDALEPVQYILDRHKDIESDCLLTLIHYRTQILISPSIQP